MENVITKSIALDNLGIKNAIVRYQLTSEELHDELVKNGKGLNLL